MRALAITALCISGCCWNRPSSSITLSAVQDPAEAHATQQCSIRIIATNAVGPVQWKDVSTPPGWRTSTVGETAFQFDGEIGMGWDSPNESPRCKVTAVSQCMQPSAADRAPEVGFYEFVDNRPEQQGTAVYISIGQAFPPPAVVGTQVIMVYARGLGQGDRVWFSHPDGSGGNPDSPFLLANEGQPQGDGWFLHTFDLRLKGKPCRDLVTQSRIRMNFSGTGVSVQKVRARIS